jgi:electron transport complex protein RnfB
VDCIELVPASGARSGWQAWSSEQADEARERFEFHRFRLDREREENDLRLAERAQLKLTDLAAHSRIENPAVLAAKRAVIEAALKRGRGSAQPTADTPDAD